MIAIKTRAKKKPPTARKLNKEGKEVLMYLEQAQAFLDLTGKSLKEAKAYGWSGSVSNLQHDLQKLINELKSEDA